MTGRALLRDPDLERQVEAEGYGTLPMLSTAEVAELVARSAGLHHEVTVDRSFAAGFHATIIDDRPDYRRAAHRAIVDVVAPHVERMAIAVDIAMSNWLHKAPGAAAVPNHIDWTFVDEQFHRSLSIWIPLCDTDARSGALGAVAGSHHRVDFVRAAANPTYEETDAFGRTLGGRRVIPLRAGEAVVFDHRLVHFSAPHLGDRERLAITCELVPREAELLHFEQLGAGRFRRHVVDPEFFVTYAAGQDPTTVAGHRSVSVVDGRSFDGAFYR